MHYLLIEDHPLVREGMMQCIMQFQPDAKFTQASSCARALAVLDSMNAEIDVVLLDMGLPDSQGIETLQRVRKACTTQSIGIVSGNNDLDLAVQCIQNGASCVIPKHGDLAEFELGLRALAQRRVYFPKELFVASRVDFNDVSTPGEELLTPRQRDVLKLLLRGCSNSIIGTELHISPETVKLHVSAIYRAYRVASRVELFLSCANRSVKAPDFIGQR
ncbi:response regulator [Variovorax terrae]|uniref:Response regulator transcription factor n=1 Tax=Variovorax terrae TaxID=2923278 RepID=A0A9X1W045_9BURK|nr:response regulator transcription factor [Variovorax terrae]MCJ0763643.1 response regulator transcription factor [Variovorax terrae]